MQPALDLDLATIATSEIRDLYPFYADVCAGAGRAEPEVIAAVDDRLDALGFNPRRRWREIVDAARRRLDGDHVDHEISRRLAIAASFASDARRIGLDRLAALELVADDCPIVRAVLDLVAE